MIGIDELHVCGHCTQVYTLPLTVNLKPALTLT